MTSIESFDASLTWIPRLAYSRALHARQGAARVLQPPYPADTVFHPAALARPDFLVEIQAFAVVPCAP